MDERQIANEMIDTLEANEEIRVTNGSEEIFIMSVDHKEGYAYVSNTNEEFKDAREAINWAIEYFEGIDNIEQWE